MPTRIGQIARNERNNVISWNFLLSDIEELTNGFHSPVFSRDGVSYQFAYHVIGRVHILCIMFRKQFEVVTEDFKVALNKITKTRLELRFVGNSSFFTWTWILNKDDFKVLRQHGSKVFKWSFSEKVVTLTGADKFAEDLKGLYLSNDIDTDMVLIAKNCGGNLRFLAHSLIIERRAETMPLTPSEPPGSPVIWETNCCDPRFFEDFLLYLYSGSVMFTAGNVLGLYETALKCKMQDLETQCMLFIAKNMSVDIYFEVVVLVIKKFDPSAKEEDIPPFILKEAAIDYFAAKQEITLSPKWELLGRNNPEIQSRILQLNGDPATRRNAFFPFLQQWLANI